MRKFYLLLIPLFALAMLVGCSSEVPVTTEKTDAVTEYTGDILNGKHTVMLKTSKGDIILELDADAAPRTVTNFVVLAREGYYDNLTFHRVIPEFMIQGGDPNGDGTGGRSIFGEMFEDEINAESYGLSERRLADEVDGQQLPEKLQDATVKDYYTMVGYRYNANLASLRMDRGAVAMANRGPNTNGSQFFIVVRREGTPWLEGKHTVFGKVTEGMDVVDEIVSSERGADDRPVEEVAFRVEVIE